MLTTKEIKRLPIFSHFKRKELHEIICNSFLKLLSKNDLLFKVKDKRDVFFIVLEGEISILRTLGETTETVEIITKGEHIAEHALFNPKEKHAHSAQVYSETARVMGIKGKRFKKISKETRLKLVLNLLPLISDNFSHASNRMLTISQIGQILGSSLMRVDALGEAILKILLDAIEAQKALIALTDGNQNRVKIKAAYGFDDDHRTTAKTIIIQDDPVLQKIVGEGQGVNIPPAEYLVSTKKVPYITSSVLGIPLFIEGTVIGGLLLIDKKNQASFNVNNEALLQIISKMVALGLRHAQEYEVKEAEQELNREYITV